MNRIFTRWLLILLAGLGLLAACRPAPTPDAAVVLEAVNTAVALTMEAQNATQTAQAAAAASETPPPPPPTATPQPVAPTATPIPPTLGVDTGGSGTGYTPPPPKCVLVGQEPMDGAELRPEQDFDIVWTLQNNSTVTWPQNADISFLSGTNIGKQTLYHLPQDVPPGSSITIRIDAVAPKAEGFYVSQWAIRADQVYCRPFFAFYVKIP